MSWTSFWIIFAITVICNFLSRAVPMVALSGRKMSDGVERALSYIPTAAFAALVASDLFDPANLALGIWPLLRPMLAALPVVVVAKKSKSLGLCIVVGVGFYWLLTLI